MKKKRNIFAVILIVLLIAIACVFWMQQSAGTSEKGLLPLQDKAAEKLDEYKLGWYNDILSVMIDARGKESEREIVHEYIVVNNASFSGIEYVNVKIFSDQTGEMTRKFYSSEGRRAYSEQISLTEEQTTSIIALIIALIEENHFWEIPSEHIEEQLGLDGNTVFIEGCNENKYNIVSMWSPDETYEIRKIYDGMLNYAALWGLNRE